MAGAVNNFALLIEHFVVLQDVFAHLEVLVFHHGLGTLDGIGNHLRLDRNIIRNIEAVHHVFHGLADESHHQLISHGQVEPGFTWVALASRTATQLVVDTT